MFTQTARADYFGLEVVERTDLPICQDPSEPEIPYKLDVCEIHVVFDDPADRLISTALCDVSTTAPQGFFQHSMNYRDTAPACALIALEPTVECDSFVTLGVDCGPAPPDLDGSTPDPDFDSAGFNSSGEVSGGWYNSAPPNGQGVPDANGRVMIARFSYKQNKNTTGNVCVFAKLAGSDEITEFLVQPFDCSIPGGGLPPGGGPNPGCVDATGSCLEVHDSTGCDNPECCETVCARAPLCCVFPFTWTAECVAIACAECDPVELEECADATGSCFEDHEGIVGCDCPECCNLICCVDPWCCDPGNGWDQMCQDEACLYCALDRCQDCDGNGVVDGDDIDNGTHEDCNANRVPDVCEIDTAQGEEFHCPGECNPVCGTCTGLCDPDCNANGIPDDCEDCNGNGLADECDIDDGTSEDINGNGIPDECEDCNINGILDECDLDCGVQGGYCDVTGCGLRPDCDGNGNPDECDIDMDSTAPGGPFFCDPAIQTCDPDCNNTGIPDACDIDKGTSQDCNSNGIPDACDIDMDSTAPGGPFFCDPAIQTCDPDCNINGIPDECDIDNGTSDDLDLNGIPDECEEDCNLNGIVDAFDIANETSEDCNANSVPDECDVAVRGPILLSGHDADYGGAHCWGAPNACGDLYGALLSFAVDNSRVLPPEEARILAIGVNDRPDSDAAQALTWFNHTDNAGPGAELDFATTPAEIAAADFTQFSAVYIPSSSIPPLTEGGITQVQLDALNARQADLDGFVNFLGGGVIALTEAFLDNAYEWLPVPIDAQDQQHFEACPTPALADIPGHTADTCDDLSPGGPYHTIFTGPPSFSGLSGLAVTNDAPVGEALLLGELDFVSQFDCNGDGTIDECQCPTDVDGDGQTGAFDLAVLLGCWGPLPGIPQCNCLLDADGDGNIGAFDLAFLLGNWGPCE